MTVFELPRGDHAKPPRGAIRRNLGLGTPVLPTPLAPSGTTPLSGSPEPGTMVHWRIVAAWPVYLALGLAGAMTAAGVGGVDDGRGVSRVVSVVAGRLGGVPLAQQEDGVEGLVGPELVLGGDVIK